ncbi:ABC transporter permease [Chelatococcus asaccharovorans]|uniref:Peptide/nickel transport system permease protein n=1 Tax=Chelatococcus asaccharovorans TaxID=28210 RepID=A0A2V3U9U9_9HYPH|nr:ABC transporter permease [Chelatococcus asaccharovorans]MBS7705416.1 ABC transporter permease [Chelatococcus asaccharovorans]PXW60180.1 peptide/nickel transport system permease protein [Chelatococcus asaccharovorans]CAH1655408.1 Glutathione transport system permease protein GsiD [Chelatococcus asaccharovorans]CAH1685435.1 Glutathione transport system permease protein GsiD [Chelatococcus asaccharovorans]
MSAADIRTDAVRKGGFDPSAGARSRWLRPSLYNISLAMIVVIGFVAIAAPFVAPYDPLQQDILQRLKGPSTAHWLGTDWLGRDILSRIIYGLRSSLSISAGAVFVALLAGGILGLAAAYYKGWTDRIIMRLMDILFAFPVMLLAIGVIALLGPGRFPTGAAIAIVYTPIFARLLRAPALVVAASDYVLSARAIGASDLRIIAFHILPNLASVILVQVSLLLSTAILVEASLSFLGLGTQPPLPSLGMMLSEGRNFLFLAPWAAVFAGLAILIVAFALNLFGDALRDDLDPRLK